uniref:Uncharacterized protein n=1 Tax=Ditylenchus dipsaci TaxID=166011 RepID=A0A915EI52_9BILA
MIPGASSYAAPNYPSYSQYSPAPAAQYQRPPEPYYYPSSQPSAAQPQQNYYPTAPQQQQQPQTFYVPAVQQQQQTALPYQAPQTPAPQPLSYPISAPQALPALPPALHKRLNNLCLLNHYLH